VSKDADGDDRKVSAMLPKLPTFYRPEMAVKSVRLPSPSAKKPAEFIRHLETRGYALDIKSFEPATQDDLSTAHNVHYVSRVLSCEEPNGFGETSREVAESLPYTTGSFVAAVKHVLEGHAPVAFSPTSGFHHAGYDHGKGFCTFNGLIVAALAAQAAGAKKVGILDCDMHFGDGTEEIIETLELRDFIVHRTAGAVFRPKSPSKDFLPWLGDALWALRECDVLLYQAGADPHVDDDYVGFLTDPEMEIRDHVVFAFCRRNKIPVAFNLAGGYRTDERGSILPVLKTHENTVRACFDVYNAKEE